MALNDAVLFVGGIAIPVILLSTVATYVAAIIVLGLMCYAVYLKRKPLPEKKLLDDIRHHRI